MNASAYSDMFSLKHSLPKTLGLLLLVLIAAPTAQAGRHVISSLPYTFGASSHTADAVDTIVLAGSMSCSNGLVLTAEYGNRLHGIFVDLGSDTISFSGSYGLRITGTSSYFPYDVEVRGGYILHNNASSNGTRTIQISGRDILLKNVVATVRGSNGIVVDAGDQYTYRNEIDGCRFTSYVTGYDSRCNYDAVVMKLDNNYSSTLTDNNAEYHWKIHHTVIEDGPHVGIYLAGREGNEHYAVGHIYACSISTDARNDFYTSYSGTCKSSSNPYGITCRHVDAGTKIYDNIIRSGTRQGGNRGMMFEYARGSQNNPILVYGNYVDVHEGPNVEYGDALPTHGLRIRYQPQHMEVYNNTFICTGDSDPGTADYGLSVHPVRLSTNSSTTHVRIRNNTVKAKSLSASGVTCYGVTFDGIDYDSTYWLEHNNIMSVGTVYKFGEIGTQSNGPTGVIIEGDTVSFDEITIQPHTYYLGHLGNNWNCSRNIARDIVYRGGTNDDDIAFASSGTLDIALQKTVSVTVKGSNDLPIPGAEVIVTNSYDQAVLWGITGASGTVAGPVTYRWVARTDDSSSYNGFSLKAKKGTDSATAGFDVSAVSSTPTVILEGTAGTPDTIPPTQIMDLGAETGVLDGTINLSWTAPGNDGDQGFASSYDIRYSTSFIDEATWTSTMSYGTAPAPVLAGNSQSFTMSDLTPGTLYYIAVKTTDASGNEAGISNVASAEAKLGIVTGDDDAELALVSPRNDSIVNTSQPTLIVANINGQSGNLYRFEVAGDSSFTSLAAASPAVPQESGSTTAWKVDTRLSASQLYFWRARANDSPYSSIYSFRVNPQTHAYPNPFMPGAVDEVVFTEVPSGSNLVILTVSGDLTRRWAGNSGQDIHWDGTNESGNLVSSGTYLWYIEDSGLKGKLIVIR